MATDPIIIPHGGYKDLLCYKKSVVIFAGTAIYCKRFLRHPDRTIDQMVQAARSCKQNIIEGRQASATSKETEIKLTNVARASLEELLEDFKDQLLTNGLTPWPVNDERTIRLRSFCRERDEWTQYVSLFQTRSMEELCNLSICLIHQTSLLLDKLLEHLVEDFKNHGGLRERMSSARHEARGADWSKALYDHLAAATSLEDLNARFREIEQKLYSTKEGIARRRGWRSQ